MEGPGILNLIVAQNVVIAIVGQNAKIAGFGGVPPTIEGGDQQFTSTEYETERALVGAISCVALDANFGHRASAEPLGQGTG
jgi:D-aminopeptidase